MELGYITARIYTSDAELPIEGAAFSVISADENDPKLLGTRITDENGKTTNIEIEAPNSELSQNPRNPTPYTSVNIRVDHPDFNTRYVEGVQIFAGQVAVQNVPMIPTDDHIEPDLKSDTYYIEPNINL